MLFFTVIYLYSRSSGVREWINKSCTIERFDNKNLNELVDKNANTKSMHEKAKMSGAKKMCLREVGSEKAVRDCSREQVRRRSVTNTATKIVGPGNVVVARWSESDTLTASIRTKT